MGCSHTQQGKTGRRQGEGGHRVEGEGRKRKLVQGPGATYAVHRSVDERRDMKVQGGKRA